MLEGSCGGGARGRGGVGAAMLSCMGPLCTATVVPSAPDVWPRLMSTTALWGGQYPHPDMEDGAEVQRGAESDRRSHSLGQTEPGLKARLSCLAPQYLRWRSRRGPRQGAVTYSPVLMAPSLSLPGWQSVYAGLWLICGSSGQSERPCRCDPAPWYHLQLGRSC